MLARALSVLHRQNPSVANQAYANIMQELSCNVNDLNRFNQSLRTYALSVDANQTLKGNYAQVKPVQDPLGKMDAVDEYGCIKENGLDVCVGPGAIRMVGGKFLPLVARGAGGIIGAKGIPSGTKLTFDSASKTWTTPKGMVYGQGSAEGNRIQHVLEHTVPDPSKPAHTVFNVDRNQVLGLIDEAWATRGAPLPNDPGAYVIPMGRVVGQGGETSIKIVVRPGTSNVITAYPVR
jgi:hypothetical protein